MITDSKWNPKFHVFPQNGGWANDPNGLCQINGLYHVFYQYRPDAADGSGRVFWGHSVSEDLLHWEFKGAPIAPDTDLDKNGAYSGSALVENGVMKLFYTGNVKLPGDYDYTTAGRLSNTILVESRDGGATFTPKKAVMTNADYPADISCHIRDPKVWKEDGKYYMVLGARTKADKGEVILFSSNDTEHWKTEKVLTTKDPFGYMWECPDLFMLGGRKFLSLCPQGVKADGILYNNIYQSGYFTVDNGQLQDFTEWDRGFDFYAPQSFVDEQGRRLFIGWMGMSDSPFPNPSTKVGWQHMLTLPRVLETYEKDGKMKIAQRLLPEIGLLHGAAEEIKVGTDSRPYSCFHAEIENAGGDFSVRFGDMELHYSQAQGRMALLFTNWGNSIGAGRSGRRAIVGDVHKLDIVIDVSSAEIFVNDGEEVFTTRIYPESALPLHTYGKGLSGRIYELNV